MVTLGRWRRHTALLERQCQEVYRSSAASLLHLGDRARKDSVVRGRPFEHSLGPGWYFRSLLDARYRQLIAKEALAEAKKGSPVTKKQR